MSGWIDRAQAEVGRIPAAFMAVPERLPELGAMAAGTWLMHKLTDMLDSAWGYEQGSGYANISPMEQGYRAVEESLMFVIKLALARQSGLADMTKLPGTASL